MRFPASTQYVILGFLYDVEVVKSYPSRTQIPVVRLPISGANEIFSFGSFSGLSLAFEGLSIRGRVDRLQSHAG